jgi:iron complex outermembrane receptor protein
MKKLFVSVSALLFGISLVAQQRQKDSIEIEKLDEVLVQAVRVKAESPITHTNISKKEISKRNLGQDMPEILKFLPSVVNTSDAGASVGYTGLRIRGVSSQSTNVTINGIPYNDAESLGTFWVNLGDFASSTESLQLQRGVGTSTNGSGAFGASVNILTDATTYEPTGEISTSFGSFNTRKHTIKFSTGLMNDHFEISGRLSNIASDGYIDRARADLKSYFLQGTYLDGNTRIKAVVFGGEEVTYQSWFGFDPATVAAVGENPNIDENRRYNISGIQMDDTGAITGYYDNQVDNYNQDHYQLHWNQRYAKNWSTTLSFNYTYGRGYFEEYVDDYYYSNILFAPDASFNFLGLEAITVGGELVDSQDYVRRRWLDNDFYVVNANANYKTNTLDLIFGTSFSHYDGDHFGEVIWAEYASELPPGERYYEGNGKKNDLSAFVKASYQLNDKLSLFGDLQIRNVNYETSGQESTSLQPFDIDVNYTFFNPKAGITYELNTSNDLYFSYARANREPRRADFENNPEVRPEQLNDFEMGWRHKKGGFSFNANSYFMLYQDQLVLTGDLDDVGSPIRTNSGNSYRIGLEMEAVIPLGERWTLQPNLTLSSNRNQDFIASVDGDLLNLGTTEIAFSPGIVGANAIIFRPIDPLQLSFLSKYVGDQFMSNTEAELSRLEAYFIHDFNLVYTIETDRVFDRIVLTGLVNNLFNEEFISNGYYYSGDGFEGAGFYPQATINFLAGISLFF